MTSFSIFKCILSFQNIHYFEHYSMVHFYYCFWMIGTYRISIPFTHTTMINLSFPFTSPLFFSFYYFILSPRIVFLFGQYWLLYVIWTRNVIPLLFYIPRVYDYSLSSVMVSFWGNSYIVIQIIIYLLPIEPSWGTWQMWNIEIVLFREHGCKYKILFIRENKYVRI